MIFQCMAEGLASSNSLKFADGKGRISAITSPRGLEFGVWGGRRCRTRRPAREHVGVLPLCRGMVTAVNARLQACEFGGMRKGLPKANGRRLISPAVWNFTFARVTS
jgi:hypothetical protein